MVRRSYAAIRSDQIAVGVGVAMATTVDQVIATARKEVGYREGKSRSGAFNNNTKYADAVKGLEWADFQPWCCTFVAWVAMKAGVPKLYPRTASCDTAGLWFKARKRWSEWPAVGAQVFYGSPKDLNHTGLVVAYDDTFIHTIEGNTNDTGAREGNGVYTKTRRRRDANVVGYGYPLFDEPIDAADLKLHGGQGVNAAGVVQTKRPKGNAIDGVDISHWQEGPFDWEAASKAGVKFVVHKVTDGTVFLDEKYEPRRVRVADAGLVWGGYHFARPEKSTGAKQAQFFLSRLLPMPGDLRPVLDLERTGGLNPKRLGAWAQDFVDEVKLRLGVEPIIYTPFNLPARMGPLWVARYSDTNKPPRIPKPWQSYDLWQFSDGVFGHPSTVPGLGHVDGNTLAAGALGLDKLRIPGRKAASAPRRRAARAVAHVLVTNERHAAALHALRGPKGKAIADEALDALEKEKRSLETLPV
jgi:hypothetical protein